MRAAVLMPVLILAVSAGHAEMGFAQGLPGQVNSTTSGASDPTLMSGGKSGRIVVAYGAAYGAPGNQPNYAPNGGRPNVSMPGGAPDDTSGLTPEQRAAAALATIKIPGFSGSSQATPPGYQPAMPTISSVSPAYSAGPVATSAVPMPASAGLARAVQPVPTQVVVPTRTPGRITGLPIGVANNMGGAASAPLVNDINTPPSAQPHGDGSPTQVYTPAPTFTPAPTYAAGTVPAYRATAPSYGAPTAQTVTYRAPVYVPPQPAYVPPKPAPMSYARPVQTPVDPASCGPAAVATPAAYVPPQPVELPRPAAPERLPVVAGGPGFTLVAPPPGAPYPNAGYVEPSGVVTRPAAAVGTTPAVVPVPVVAPPPAAPAAFLPTTQPHDVGTVRGVRSVRAVNRARLTRPAGTNTDPWEAAQ